jgi:Sulfotransferase family
MARDLEKAPSRDEEEEEVYPLILNDDDDEEDGYRIKDKNVSHKSALSSPSSPLFRSRRNKYIVLCVLITVIALVTTVLSVLPVSQAGGRLTSTIKAAFQTALALQDDEDDNASTQTTQHPPSPMQQHVDYHTNRFDYTSSWCPNANCKGTSICYPCQRRWLIIITTGRSASTTLTEMVNRLPGVRMTGENKNLIERFENAILKESPIEMLDGQYPAWFHDNPIPEESFSCAAQHVFTTFNPPKLATNKDKYGNNNLHDWLEKSDEETILGFKTIRLLDSKMMLNLSNSSSRQIQKLQMQEHIQSKISTLNHLFPCARFIVNYRSNVPQQASSRVANFVGATNVTQTLQLIQLENEMLQMFHNMRINGYADQSQQRWRSSYLLDSTIWTQNISAFNAMLDWLGFSPACHFSAALEYNTKNGYSATKTEMDDDEWSSRQEDCMYLY